MAKVRYRCFFAFVFLLQVQRRKRADERTRTADLISLRVGCFRVRLVLPGIAPVGISVGIKASALRMGHIIVRRFR
jgi:hypothetical protein